jgi:hypothetical protein
LSRSIAYVVSTLLSSDVIIGLAKVVTVPFKKTVVAELVATATGDVFAAVNFFDEHSALGAPLPPCENLLEVDLASTLVLGQFALLAEGD